MAVYLENIKPGKGQSLRFLSWTRGVERVCLHTSAGQYEEIDGAGVLWHRHPEIELTIVTSGSGLRMVGNHLGRFAGDDIALIGRNVPHYWRMQSDSSGYCLQFDPNRKGGIWQSPEFVALGKLWKRAQRGLQINGELAGSLRKIITELPNLSPLSRMARLIELLELIEGDNRNEALPLASADFRIPEADDPYGEVIAEVIEVITTGFHNELRLEEVIERQPLSRATFARHFKINTGKSFSAFLAEVRVNSACHELATTCRSVTEIAFDSGFNDLPHFNRMFRKLKGTSPLKWKKAHGAF